MERKFKKPVLASTVILIRPYNEELQVYLLKRSKQSGFMAGKYVFPGGKVDPEDFGLKIGDLHIDLDADGIKKRFGDGISSEKMCALSTAAVRETFEEAGVFFAYRERQSEKDIKQVCEMRLKENCLPGWFMKQVISEKWVLNFGALFGWSHWITPALMKHRFDTYFFIASLPQGQICVPDTREAVDGIWISPEKGLTGNLEGKIPLSPPTLVTLHELLKYSDLDSLNKDIKNRKWHRTLLPRLVPLKHGAVILEPWDPAYNRENIKLDIKSIKDDILPVGESFSRIWFDDNLWRPVRSP